jgi:tryptophanyl-tRNA synthetase
MKKSEKFDPWEVSGEVNYDKLVKEFGVKPMKKLPDVFKESVLFRRGIVFAQRDIQRILDAVKNKKPFVMMTGLMPTGKFHIGHMLVAQQFVFWQKLGAKVYIAVADLESYNARGLSLEEARKNAMEYISNYVALGLDLNKADVYFQSHRSDNPQKANKYYELQNLLSRHSTFAEFKAVYGEITPGKMSSALLQASDMIHPQLNEFEGKENKGLPVLIPVGIDQDPHIRLARDILKRYTNYSKTDFVQLSSSYHTFMPGLGGGKMSSSKENSYIALTDSPSEVKKKINKYAFSGGQPTLEEHKKKGGNPDIDVPFQYLKMFFEQDDGKLKEIEELYKKGEMMTGELKNYTIGKINEFLKNHQKKLESAKNEVKRKLG